MFIKTVQKKVSSSYIWDSISVDFRKNQFECQGCVGRNRSKSFSVQNNDLLFYFLFKIATSFDYPEDTEETVIDLIEYIGHPIPKENIRIYNERYDGDEEDL